MSRKLIRYVTCLSSFNWQNLCLLGAAMLITKAHMYRHFLYQRVWNCYFKSSRMDFICPGLVKLNILARFKLWSFFHIFYIYSIIMVYLFTFRINAHFVNLSICSNALFTILTVIALKFFSDMIFFFLW